MLWTSRRAIGLASRSVRQAALVTVAVAAALAVACTRSPLVRLVKPPTPHEAYVDTLQESDLHDTALGRDWLEASTRALTRPLAIDLPFHETGYFAPDKPMAVAYRFSVQRGRLLAIDASFTSLGNGRLFVDLFRITSDAAPEHVAAITAEMEQATVEIEEAGDYLLRVQPELLRGGRFSLVERTLASLPFPVTGLGRRVQSGFGAERDGGARQHEGVDIFAPAGTPVVAVAAGTAEPSTNTLGGNVVWLRDRARRQTFYYAHLQRAALGTSAEVATGDVLGYVGNTGNARTTAPHLHFGVYRRAAIDPLPFIDVDQAPPPPPAVDLELGALARVRSREAGLSAGVSARAPLIGTLPRATLLTVFGASNRSLRVVLPDGVEGYVSRLSVGAATEPLGRRRLAAGVVVLERPLEASAVVHVVDKALQVAVLGRFGAYELVRTASLNGWVLNAGLIGS